MIKVEYPSYQPKIKIENGVEYIYDSYRNKWVVLTPEEWVRQNFLNYLVQLKQYPKSLIAIEKEILLGDIKKRFDIVVFNKLLQPWMLVECKEMNVPISEKTLSQIINYNSKLKASYLVLTNGKHCMALDTFENKWLMQMPNYQ